MYPSQSTRVDYEAELAVVIRDKCKDLEPENVMEHVEGFTCLNDVTARDLQKKDGQWTRDKSFDTFCPVGPKIVNGVEPNKLKIQSYLNSELRQDSNTSNFIFTVEDLVSFASKVMTLLPRDLIATGTPSGIGAMKPRGYYRNKNRRDRDVEELCEVKFFPPQLKIKKTLKGEIQEDLGMN